MRERSRVHKGPYHLQVDYYISDELVYTKASWDTICEMKDLKLLSLIEDASVRTLQNLLSWVPDYSTAPQTHPLIGSLRATVGWNASDGLRWEVPLQADLLSLLVKGIYFDTIEFAAGAERITEAQWITDHRHMKTLLDLLAHFSQPRYRGGDTPIEAFWRTLIKDTIGWPADEEAPEAFQMLIALRVWELEETFKNLRGSPSKLPNYQERTLMSSQLYTLKQKPPS
jgi:hypothetical protein